MFYTVATRLSCNNATQAEAGVSAVRCAAFSQVASTLRVMLVMVYSAHTCQASKRHGVQVSNNWGRDRAEDLRRDQGLASLSQCLRCSTLKPGPNPTLTRSP